MKKVLAIVLSALMILCCAPVAFAAEKTAEPAAAYAEYDRAKVAANDAEYIASLNWDQLAGVLLDWLDRQIAEKTADFDKFEVEAFGQTVAVDLDINGVDDLVKYADHLADLGGDFANLDASELKTLSRANGDVNFLYGVIGFMAKNADVFGKVFRWDEGRFDYGKVGEYITTELAGTEIEKFYTDVLLNNDIQKKFVTEIAREMGYDWDGEENFDDVINNGVKAKVIEFAGDLLSAESVAAINDNEQFDLRTDDAYTLVKNFIGLLQNDNKAKLDDMLKGFMEALQGAIGVVKDSVNIEPPTVEIGDANTVVGTYHPGSTDPESYMPAIYSPYKDQLQGTEYYDMIAGSELPEEFAAIVAEGGVDMAEKFVMNVAPVPQQLTDAGFVFPIEIGFDDIETFANAQIAAVLAQDENNNGVGDIQDQVNEAVTAAISGGQAMIDALPFDLGITLEGSATINSVTVSLSYKGYSDEDTFIVEVTAIPEIDISFDGNVWTYAQYAGITQDKIKTDYIQPAIDEILVNPAATVVVTNLSGVIEELAQIEELVNFIDVDAEYDYSLLDVMTPYDEYKGVVGQANRILCDAIKMIATDEGYASLGLVEGENKNLTANLQKLCDKISNLLETAKKYIPREQFIALADAANIGAGFASSHGFNAGMIYDMDFSSIENALVCGIRMACDLLVEDDETSDLYKFHLRVENLETLDAMAAAGVDMLLEKAVNALDIGYNYKAINYAKVKKDGAKAAILNKVSNILFYCANYAVDKINEEANKLIADINEKFDLNVGEAAFALNVKETKKWSTDLTALADRFLALADGLLIPAGDARTAKSLWTKTDAILSALPMNSMFSNYKGSSAAVSAFFDKALDGDFVSFLSLFEVKSDDLAGGVPVTKALINASEYIVDRFFPDTVNAEDYAPSLTVQQEFTGAANDQVIAANNMRSINERKAHLVPAALDLIKESGILASLAACVHGGETVEIPAVDPTCTEPGSTAGVKCADCGAVIEEPQEIPALGHVDENGDGVCDRCKNEMPADPEPETPDEPDEPAPTGIRGFFQRIVDFFQRIVNWFKNLFKR